MSKNMLDFPYHHVLVLGLAKSGSSAANLLLVNGKKVRINDMNANEHDTEVNHLKELGAEIVLGHHPISVLNNIDIIVKNPGIPYDLPLIIEAEKRNIPIITEIELAGRLLKEQIIGITGSNGKTTTTTLVTKMLEKSNQQVKVAGNIGIVASDVAQEITQDEHLVLELSSFQLLGTLTFRPHIAMILNINEAHLDYHKTMANYKQSKFNIFSHQTPDDYLIYNADDTIVTEGVKKAASTLVPFSTKHQILDGAWTDEMSIYFKDEKIIDIKDITLVGKHNLENILAAICAAKLSGGTNEAIHDVLTTFTGVKHRLQYVDKINGRLFYNDSKATNILATQKALQSFKQPVIWLAGGLDRGNEFDELLPYLKHIKAMVLFGETANKLKRLGEKAGIHTIEVVDSMNDAVHKAYSLSEKRDLLLLSPACASWDQYRTFEERGDMFIQAMHTLV